MLVYLQGIVAMHMRCGRIFSDRYTGNLLLSVSLKESKQEAQMLLKNSRSHLLIYSFKRKSAFEVSFVQYVTCV